MSGYTRTDMGAWKLRVVTDRGAALAYLAALWGELLPADFYGWLATARHGATYVLTGPVHCPELWLIPPYEIPA